MLAIIASKNPMKAARALVKKGIKNGDMVTTIIPKERAQEYTELHKTLNTLLEIALEHPTITTLEIQSSDFISSVTTIRKHIMERHERPIYIYINDTTIITIEILTAVITTNIDAEIIIEEENNVVTLRTIDLRPETLSNTDIEILKTIAKQETDLIDIAKTLNTPKSTIWKRLMSLERKGLVTTRKQGRRIRAAITQKGQLYIWQNT